MFFSMIITLQNQYYYFQEELAQCVPEKFYYKFSDPYIAGANVIVSERVNFYLFLTSSFES